MGIVPDDLAKASRDELKALAGKLDKASVSAATLTPEQKRELICEEIAAGCSLRAVCARPGMPDQRTVRRWLREEPPFRLQYAQAREDQADHYADEIVEISDAAEDPAKARLQIDARKWVAAKLRPKKYGDKLDVGGDVGLSIRVMRFGGDAPQPVDAAALPAPVLDGVGTGD